MSKTRKELIADGCVDPLVLDDADSMRVRDIEAQMRTLGEKAKPLSGDDGNVLLRHLEREAKASGAPGL